VGELLFNVLPAFDKKRAFVVEADKDHIRAPTQPIADMKGRGVAAGKLLFAVRAVKFFVINR
jgi:hypothetical protein